MSKPLTTVERVAARAAIPMPLSGTDAALAHEVIAIASGLVRRAGLPWATYEEAPDVATAICTEAAARAFMNPTGLTSERSDALSAGRADVQASGVHLTPAEREVLAEFRHGAGALLSTPLVSDQGHVPRSSLGYMQGPTSYTGLPFAGGYRKGVRHAADYLGRFYL